MKNTLLRAVRCQKGWNQQQLADFAEVSLSTVERAERGEAVRIDTIQRLSACLQKTPEQLGLCQTVNSCQADQTVTHLANGLLPTPSPELGDQPPLGKLWADDLLTIYARGIAACQDLYFGGNPYHVEAILPLYSNQTAQLARQPSPLQQAAAKLASQAQQLACELATDREDFGTAQRTAEQAFAYAQLAGDSSLQVASLIGLANIGFHRKLSTAALRAYEHAISLLDEQVTPLLKGRTYAGIAEVYAMRGQFQETMQAMGFAYEHYPLKPEDDPAYPYLRASRYALYVFGDVQSLLFLAQPKEADQALIAMQQETNDPQIEPVTKLDMLYYQADVQIQQGELEASSTILAEAATLAKSLGSLLYFNKLVASYQKLQAQWPRESLVVALEEVFQPWEFSTICPSPNSISSTS